MSCTIPTMSDGARIPSEVLVHRFLRRALEDRESGALRPLGVYLDLFPGHDAAVAREWIRLAAAAGDAQDGAERFGPYLLLRSLGSGGQGHVHLAEDTRLSRRVALKILPRGTGTDDLRRFRREAEIASRLEHPGICTVYEAGSEDGTPFIAMRFVEGKSLATLLAEQRQRPGGEASTLKLDFDSKSPPSAPSTPVTVVDGPSTREEILRVVHLVEKAARAVHAAHEAGVIHRDLKPGNIMVTPEGEPVVLDFGLARAEWTQEAVSRTGDVFGTPPYMSPEQVRGERLDRLTDVWSLGAVLYEVLSLRRAFDGATSAAVAQQILKSEPRDLRRLNPKISEDLGAVAATALTKEKNRRYRSAEDLAEDLRRIRQHEPIRARRAGPVRRLLRWAQRKPAIAALTGILTVALGSGFLLLASKNSKLAERLSDWERLRDLQRVSQLENDADDLWPPHPENVRSMEDWVRDAESVGGRLAEHRAAHARIMSPGAAQTWKEERLADLVRNLDALVVTASGGESRLDEVKRRLEVARNLYGDSIAAHREAWRASVSRLSSAPAYGGLGLAEQIGLVPLGADLESGLEEYAVLLSGSVPERSDDYALKLRPESAIVLVLVPGGTFLMGAQADKPAAPNHDPLATESQQPPHSVTLAPYFISKYEMTQSQWERVAGDNPSFFGPDKEESKIDGGWSPLQPVEQVSFEDCLKISKRLGLVLPTEAQWERACRAGTSTVWFTGDDVASLQGSANIMDAGTIERFGVTRTAEKEFDDGRFGPAPIGRYRPNAFGLHDMAGNVFEWCQDSFNGYTERPREKDGLRMGPEKPTRVVRGGSFGHLATHSRSADRSSHPPGFRNSTVGVRPARLLDP